MVKILDEIKLYAIGIVEYPANPDSIGLILKNSINKEEYERLVQQMSKKELEEKETEVKIEEVKEGIGLNEKQEIENSISNEIEKIEKVETKVEAKEEKKEVVNSVNSEEENAKLVKLAMTKKEALSNMLEGINNSIVDMMDSITKIVETEIKLEDIISVVRLFISNYCDRMYYKAYDVLWEDLEEEEEMMNSIRYKKEIFSKTIDEIIKNSKNAIETTKEIKEENTITDNAITIITQDDITNSLNDLSKQFDAKLDELRIQLNNQNKESLELREEIVKLNKLPTNVPFVTEFNKPKVEEKTEWEKILKLHNEGKISDFEFKQKQDKFLNLKLNKMFNKE